MVTDQNQLILLSDSLHKIRELSNDTEVNVKIQDKEFMKLAEDMATIGRNANICSGIFFDLWMKSNKEKEELANKVEQLNLTEKAQPNES